MARNRIIVRLFLYTIMTFCGWLFYKNIRHCYYGVKEIKDDCNLTLPIPSPSKHTLEGLDFNMQQQRLNRIQKACSRIGRGHLLRKKYIGQNYSNLQPFLLIDSVHKVVLNSLPKTGSSTWRLALLNSSGAYALREDQKVGFVHGPSLFQSIKGVYTKPASLMQKGDVIEALNSFHTILTVRHPFDRLESAYEDLVISYNYIHIREKILQEMCSDGNHTDLHQLAVNGSNVKFEHFLQYSLSHDDRHWGSMVRASLPCKVSYGYIAKTETMATDLHHVIDTMLLGHGTKINMNIKRANSTKLQTYKEGRYLPLFSKLENNLLWIKMMAEAYADDLALFGYSYHVSHHGHVYATCEEYDEMGNCV